LIKKLFLCKKNKQLSPLKIDSAFFQQRSVRHSCATSAISSIAYRRAKDCRKTNWQS